MRWLIGAWCVAALVQAAYLLPIGRRLWPGFRGLGGCRLNLATENKGAVVGAAGLEPATSCV